MIPRATPNSTERSAAGKRALRFWRFIVGLTFLICVYPVAYQTTRVLLILGLLGVWAGALLIWWRKKLVSLPLMLTALLIIGLVSLPGRPVQTDILARDYCSALTRFTGVRYIWGGEGLLGIDCSGLVRQGMIWGELHYGIRMLNGRVIRQALALWWHDCSAKAMRDGDRGITSECFRAQSIAKLDESKLKLGDLAVTADGVHVLAWLENHRWIEADPVIGKVVEISTPTDSPWFDVPIVIVRWNCLDPGPGLKPSPKVQPMF